MLSHTLHLAAMLWSKLRSVFGSTTYWKSDRPTSGDISTGRGAQMNTTPNFKEAEANDVLIARADARLAHAYEQIAQADEQLARVTEQLSRMEQAAARESSAVPGRKASRGRTALRGLIGLLLAACIVVVALVFGDTARPLIFQWAPYLMSTQLQNSGLPAEPMPSIVQLAAAEAAPPQATPSASVVAPDIAPAVASTPPELEQLFKEMTRVLTNVEQGVGQLKEQMAGDNAKLAEQFRANQEQMTLLMSKISERNVTSRTPVPPPRLAASQANKPVQTTSSPQARVQARTPRQAASQAQ